MIYGVRCVRTERGGKRATYLFAMVYGSNPTIVYILMHNFCPDWTGRTQPYVDGKRSVVPVWTCGRAAGVVDGQHRSMSPVHEGRRDRIGSLFDDACPTAVTPDTGLTERLPWTDSSPRSDFSQVLTQPRSQVPNPHASLSHCRPLGLDRCGLRVVHPCGRSLRFHCPR